MTLIKDGTGTGYNAKVDSANRLYVNSIEQSTEHYANFTKGTAAHVVIQQTPAAAGDTFFYFKNTGTKSIVIEGFSHRVASAETIEIYLNKTGTPSGGTAISPSLANTESAEILLATIEGGNDITGLSGGRLFDRIWMSNTSTSTYNFDLDVVVAPGGTFSLQAVTGSVQVDMVIYLYESEF